MPNSKTRLLRLLSMIQKKKNPVNDQLEEFTVAEQLDMALMAKALKGDVAAYKEIFDRLEGKSQQSMDIDLGVKKEVKQFIMEIHPDTSDVPLNNGKSNGNGHA